MANIKDKWIAVDLDGTLAEHKCGWPKDWRSIGKPVPKMVERVKAWLKEGKEVRIFTARMDGYWNGQQVPVDLVRAGIQAWCKEHIGQVLKVTNRKDYYMEQLWDDKAIHVEKDTGRIIG